jgi:hypothetical protein
MVIKTIEDVCCIVNAVKALHFQTTPVDSQSENYRHILDQIVCLQEAQASIAVDNIVQQYKHLETDSVVLDLLELADTYQFIADEYKELCAVAPIDLCLGVLIARYAAPIATGTQQPLVDIHYFNAIIKTYFSSAQPITLGAKVLMLSIKYVVYMQALQCLADFLTSSRRTLQQAQPINQFVLLHHIFYQEEQLVVLLEHYSGKLM